MPQPWNADALAQLETADALAQCIDPPDDLVARNDRQRRRRQLAIDHVQVGAAHAAGQHLDAQLAGAGLRLGNVTQVQRFAGSFQQHGAHRRLSFRLLFCCRVGRSAKKGSRYRPFEARLVG